MEALPPECTAESGGRTFLISGPAVDPDWRRKGIGRRVIQRLLAIDLSSELRIRCCPGRPVFTR
ncbi:GNAT family N-acetyltransferase [Nocardia vinacea]|uniref:GNAT family N-acetyltransferase n=1 Tax=Nocardia vinacea TaxID=96468 RepID=UPI003AF34A6B